MSCDPTSSGVCKQVTWNPNNNNLLNKIGSTTVSCDSDGDLLSDTVNSYTWDAEQRLSTVSGRWTALYNALGQRVQKQFSDTSDNLYDPSGQQIGTHDVPANDWDDQDVKFGGRNLVYFSQSGAGTRFFHVNTLGSVGYATGPAGVHVEAMVYYPFGSTWQDTTGAIWDERFASLPSVDADIQLYETLARQYSPGLGRWMTPDPAGLAATEPTNPDTFNRYAYVTNNPTNMIDPSGLFQAVSVCDKDPNAPGCSPPPDPTPACNPNSPLWSLCQNGPRTNPPNCGIYTDCGGDGHKLPTPQKPAPTVYQNCVNDFNNSTPGKIVDLFSLLSLIPGWNQNWKSDLKETAVAGSAKVVAIEGANKASKNLDITNELQFSSVTTGETTSVAGAVEGLTDAALNIIKGASEPVLASAAVVDVAAHDACVAAAHPEMAPVSAF